LFSNDKLTLNAIIQVNDYLNEKKYYELRNILFSKNIEYHDIDIKDLDKLSKDYDLIILSNVVAYLNNIYGKDFLKKFKQLIDKIKNKHTQIIICYLYANNINDYKFINDVNQNYNYYDIYNPKYVKECFDEEDYEYISFISAEQYELPCCYNDDKILVYNNKTKE